ncbi:MAG: hypothetical protein IPF42_11445 [Candidatus Microthrix sp.]|nr:hypothetical protein [Candidatus Microthrix sp.]
MATEAEHRDSTIRFFDRQWAASVIVLARSSIVRTLSDGVRRRRQMGIPVVRS